MAKGLNLDGARFDLGLAGRASPAPAWFGRIVALLRSANDVQYAEARARLARTGCAGPV
ncbi:hypothetical protein [Methylobacterium soli]|uniref:hypothetical protein n=1 Tax=Methylobacterium soli TaxID=553447 RepID=UPI00177E9EA3|nr:hypothetical protein [Methylobacterium soli]